jgi:hypothetical protein
MPCFSYAAPLGRPCRGRAASTAASLLPQSGQVSKPSAPPPPTSKIMPWCSTVTSVRTVQLGVVFADGSERKELARLDSHW